MQMKRSFDDDTNETNGSTSPTSAATSRRKLTTSPQRPLISSEAPPKISRKVKACTECKKLKIKCDMPSGNPKCLRCTRQGLECIVNRSLQTILDDDMEWKRKLGHDTCQLQQAVNAILCRLEMGDLENFSANQKVPLEMQSKQIKNEYLTQSLDEASPDQTGKDQQRPGVSPRLSHREQQSSVEATRENSHEPQDQDDAEDKLVDAPMSSLYKVTKLRTLRWAGNNLTGKTISTQLRLERDFISKGVINVEDAEELFSKFARTLNHYLWGGIALVHSDLTSVRKSSSLLASSILAVTALHLPEKAHLYCRCYNEFLNLVAGTMFDSYLSLDDIRAFCIGAFWLSDLSWKLSGHAVRQSTEMGVHRSFSKAIAGSPEHFERARLWYLLYLSDHHFSIAYNRPPVIADDESIRNYELFLKSPLVKPEDFRIVSQVALFSVLSRMYQEFGPEIDDEIPSDKLSLLHNFNTDLDLWRSTFQHRLPVNEYVASYPEKGVAFHYYAAKLQLNWCALRGMSAFHNLSAERKDFANRAIAAAISTLKVVLTEPDVRNSIVGVPLYLHTNIAMAASFLMKVAARWSGIFQIDEDVWGLVENIISLLKEARASDRHVVHYIASGLDRMLAKCREWRDKNESQASLASSWDTFLRAPEIVTFTPGADDVQGTDLGHEGIATSFITSPGPEAFGYAQIPVNDPVDGQFITEQYYPIGIYDFLATQMPG